MTAATQLLRQVHPKFVHAGVITSQVFKPTQKDDGQLSVYDGDQIAPADSWQHYTDTTRCESVGVKCVTKAECEAETLSVVSDPTPFPEHVLIDFRSLSSKQVERVIKKLKQLAVQRGWLFQSEN